MTRKRRILEPVPFIEQVEQRMARLEMSHAGMAEKLEDSMGISFRATEQLWRRARNNPNGIRFTTALAVAEAVGISLYYTEEK